MSETPPTAPPLLAPERAPYELPCLERHGSYHVVTGSLQPMPIFNGFDEEF